MPEQGQQQQGQQQGQQQQEQQQQGQQQQEQQQQGMSYETWLEQQPTEVKRLLDTHTTGLKSALTGERTARSELAKQLREASVKLEKDSDARKGLEEASAKLELAERRMGFLEEGIKPEIGCTNPKLAWLVAQEGGLFDRHGGADWGAIRTVAPELFRKAGVGSADGGAGQGKTAAFDMNTAIRRGAGR